MRFIVALFALVLLAVSAGPGLCQPAAPLAGRSFSVNTPGDTLNLRTAPSTAPSVAILKAVPHRAIVRATGPTRRVEGVQWVQVEYDGVTGWVAARFLLATSENPQDPARSPDLSPARLYPPIIAFGGEDSPEKVVFVWFASNSKSSALFKSYIRPLIDVKQVGRVSLIMVQVFDPDIRDVDGPGGLLLCADDVRQYLKLMSAYLLQGGNYEDRKPFPTVGHGFVSNAQIDLMQEAHLMDFSKCATDIPFTTRVLKALELSKVMLRRGTPPFEPRIVFRGKSLRLGDPELAGLQKLARIP
jgi:hypothetical protein